MVNMMPHGAIKVRDVATNKMFLVNGQRVKYYYSEDLS